MRRGLVSIAVFVAFAAIFTLSRHATTTPSTTSTSTNVSTTTAAPTTTTTLNPTTCKGSGFKGVFNQGQGAAGTIYASVTLTKTSAGACNLKGWPFLTLQDKQGGVLPVGLVDLPSSAGAPQFSDTRANQAPSLLAMKQGSSTTFSLAYSDVPTANTLCDDAVTMSVQLTSHDTAITITPTYPIQPCNNGRMWVSPFY